MSEEKKEVPKSHRTLYVNNLPDKISKRVLKECLYCLFIQCGRVVCIVAMKTPKMRGQAFVMFKEVQEAEYALKSLQNFNFFGKNMNIQFSKEKSETLAYLDEE